MNLILVSIHVEKTPAAFPLAAAILKTAAENDSRCTGISILLKEYYLPAASKEIAADLHQTGADSFGFSACTWNSTAVIEIAAELKRINSDLMVFVGGPQASAAPEDFQSTGLFDAVAAGEGEELIADILLGDKKGICRSSGASDFTESPSPFEAVLNNRQDCSGLLWELSRGCPYRCAFCYESRGYKTIRTLPGPRMDAELELFRKHCIEKIWVLDPTFNHDAGHAIDVLKRIISIWPDAHYTFEIRAELMNEELCSLFSEIDASLQIGLQTINPAALKSINRSLQPKKFLDKCRMMSEYGLTFGIDLIYGLPGDTYETFKESLDFAVSAAPNNIDIFPLSVLPGTEIYERAKEYSINHSGFPEYITESSATFSCTDMKHAGILTDSVDILYNREQSFAWLQTAASALKIQPSALFEEFSRHRNNNPLDFIKTEMRRRKLARLLPTIESFINWSRTAETAISNPGRSYEVRLRHKPEVLDELAYTDPENFVNKHSGGKERMYRIYFDGEDLFIN